VPNQEAVSWYLRVAEDRAEGVIVLTISGRVSSLTARQLEAALDSTLGHSARGVVLDLSGVDYISSPGLRALEKISALLAAAGRRLVVCGLTDAVRLAFSLAGLESSLAIEASRDSAINVARA
jgi:anti-anti-sigma factor